LIPGDRQLLFEGMGRITEGSLLSVKSRSHSVTARFEVPAGGANGVLVAQGGTFGGWSIFLREGRPAYCYNLFGMARFHIEGEGAVPEGAHELRLEFDYDGGGRGKGGTASLYLDGAPVGETRMEATVPVLFSLDETADVGRDTGTTVSDRYTVQDSEFTGRIEWVEIDVGASASDTDHVLDPEERLRLAMARQ
jgi:hypothetical protein